MYTFVYMLIHLYTFVYMCYTLFIHVLYIVYTFVYIDCYTSVYMFFNFPSEPPKAPEVVAASAAQTLLPHAPEVRMAGIHKPLQNNMK